MLTSDPRQRRRRAVKPGGIASTSEESGGEVWDRFTVHYTPTHGSWLNQAEIEIGILSRQCLGTRRIPDLFTLLKEVRAWNRRINRTHTKINWRFDRKSAGRKFNYKRNTFKRSALVPPDRSAIDF
jgi:DDE superfamily endonuclease